MTADVGEHVGLSPAESARLRRIHMPERAPLIGMSVREADRLLKLNGGGNGLLDTTHFDTVRFPPPPWAAQAIHDAALDGSLAYTPYRGHPGVLESLAGPIASLLGVPVDPARNIALTPGTQAGLFTTMSALLDPGDLVLISDPEYLFSERMLAFLGARIERLPVLHDPEGGGPPDLDLAALERLLPHDKPKLVLFSHPNNPSGAVYPAQTLTRLAELAVEHDFRVLVDQLYCRLVYDETPYAHLVAEPGMADRTITLLGPSKTESLSGHRLGVVVGPEDVIDAVEQTLAVTSLRAPAYAQQLLRYWLVDDAEWMAERVADLRALREHTLERLQEVPGLRVRRQFGTAYAFPDVSALGVSDWEIAAAARRDAGMVISPGYQFGPHGMGHFRVCYARDEAEWDAALTRLVGVLRALPVTA